MRAFIDAPTSSRDQREEEQSEPDQRQQERQPGAGQREPGEQAQDTAVTTVAILAGRPASREQLERGARGAEQHAGDDHRQHPCAAVLAGRPG